MEKHKLRGEISSREAPGMTQWSCVPPNIHSLSKYCLEHSVPGTDAAL